MIQTQTCHSSASPSPTYQHDREWYHDFPVYLASHRTLVSPCPAKKGIKSGIILPLGVDVGSLVLLDVLRVPDAGLRGNLGGTISILSREQSC